MGEQRMRDTGAGASVSEPALDEAEEAEIQEAFEGLSPEEQAAIASIADAPAPVDLRLVEEPSIVPLHGVRKQQPKDPKTKEQRVRERALQNGEIHAAPLSVLTDKPAIPEPVVDPLDHRELLNAAKNALIATRNEAMMQGLPGTELFGFIFDLNDALIPPGIRNAPAAKAAIKQAGPRKAAIQTGILSRSDICHQLMWTAHKIQGTDLPLLISAQHKEPPIIQSLRAFRDAETLPVVIISQRKLSVLGISVSQLIDVAASS